MKIAITGSGGIGKTTLVNALSKQLGLPVIHEEMQPVLKALSVLHTTVADPEKHRQSQVNYVKACEKWLQNRDKAQTQDSFVSDRCAIDLLSRWLTSGVYREDDKLLLNIVTICKRLCNGLDLIVMPPLLQFEEVPANNEAGLSRQKSLVLKLQSHAMTRGLLDQLVNTPKLYLPPEAVTLEVRIELVMQALKHLGKLQ